MGNDRRSTTSQPAAGCRGPVILVSSSHAGSAQSVDPAELLADAGITVADHIPVSELDHDLPQGREWQARGFAAAIAAGGDGTIGAVATQVANTGLPMGILPMGTANDVARSLLIPLDLREAAQIIARQDAVPVDAGRAFPATTEPLSYSVEAGDDAQRWIRASRGAYFLHALTLGLNVEFARLATSVARRQRWGNLNYATAVIEAISRYNPVDVKLTLTNARQMHAPGQWTEPRETLTVEARVIQVAIANSPVFGGGIGMRLRGVELHDGVLDFVVLEALEARHLRETVNGLLEAVDRFRDTVMGNGDEHQPEDETGSGVNFLLPGVRRFQAYSSVVETPRNVDITLDGEIRSHTPVVIQAEVGPLSIFLPDASPVRARQRLNS